MRHRILTLLTALCCLVPPAFGIEIRTLEIDCDSIYSVTFNNEFIGLEVFIDSIMPDDGGCRLSMSVKNNGDNQGRPVIFFNGDYYKDDLKVISKSGCKIELKGGDIFKPFNKNKEPLNGSYIEYSPDKKWPILDDGNRNYEPKCYVIPIEKEFDNKFFVPFDTITSVHFTFYIAKPEYDKKKKFEVVQLFECVLKVTPLIAPVEADPEYEELYNEVNSFSSSTQFCNNAKHRPKLRSQKEDAINKLNGLKRRIEDVKKRYREGSEMWNGCEEMLDRINQLFESVNGNDFEVDCGKHNPINKRCKCPKNCSYCEWSKLSLETGLEKIANKIHKTGKPASTSEQNKAKAIYNCAKIHKKVTNQLTGYYKIIFPSSPPLPKPHHCGYCNQNQAQLLGNIANQLDKLGNKAKASDSQKKQAKAIYECAKANGKASGKAQEYYNKIMSR